MNDLSQQHIKSFALRAGRLTSGQKHALEAHWPRYGIEFSETKLDLDAIFRRRAPRVLDIGVGMGATTASIAKSNPDTDFIAVDVHKPGIGSLLRLVNEQASENVRVVCHDVIDIIRYQLPDNSLNAVYIFFPDPWPKKRHHKRRLVNKAFIDLLLPKIQKQGRIFIATDWQDLSEHIVDVCDSHLGLINLAGDKQCSPRPIWRPVTKFEQRGNNLDHGTWDFVFGRR